MQSWLTIGSLIACDRAVEPVEHVGRRHQQLVVVGVEFLGDEVGEFEFVTLPVADPLEADAERLQTVLTRRRPAAPRSRWSRCRRRAAPRPARRRPSAAPPRSAAFAAPGPASRRRTGPAYLLLPGVLRRPVGQIGATAVRLDGADGGRRELADARTGWSAAPAPPRGTSCSGSAPPGRSRCRRRRRPAGRAATTRTAAGPRSAPGRAA